MLNRGPRGVHPSETPESRPQTRGGPGITNCGAVIGSKLDKGAARAHVIRRHCPYWRPCILKRRLCLTLADSGRQLFQGHGAKNREMISCSM